jgi:hypothetical protein
MYLSEASSMCFIRGCVCQTDSKLPSWFHGNKSKEIAQQQLLDHKQDNLFLVRYSSTKGAFTIDYKKRGKICRFNNIENLPEGRIEVGSSEWNEANFSSPKYLQSTILDLFR